MLSQYSLLGLFGIAIEKRKAAKDEWIITLTAGSIYLNCKPNIMLSSKLSIV